MPLREVPEMPGASRIAIAGDQGLMRSAIRTLVESEQGFSVVFECDSRPEALAEALMAKPGIILLDLDLSSHCSALLERIRTLLEAAAPTAVLILTGSDESRAVQFALEHGAAGFVMKDRSPDVLHRAIRTGLAGGTWIERSTMTSMLRASTVAAEEAHGSGVDLLTSRERDIIDLVVQGLHNKAVAQRLNISDTTVRHHLTSIFDKLRVANRLELMRFVFNAAASLVPTRHTCVGAMAESGCEVARKIVASADAGSRSTPYRVISGSLNSRGGIDAN